MCCSLVPALTGTRPVTLGFPFMCVVDLVKLSRKLDASHGGTVGGLSSCAICGHLSPWADKATWQALLAYNVQI
jgi:hypothetical protein